MADYYPTRIGYAWRDAIGKEQNQLCRTIPDDGLRDQTSAMFNHVKTFTGSMRQFNGTFVEWAQKFSEMDPSQLSDIAKRSMIMEVGLRNTPTVEDQELNAEMQQQYDAVKEGVIGHLKGRPDAARSIQNNATAYTNNLATRRQKLNSVFSQEKLDPNDDNRTVKALAALSGYTRQEIWPHRERVKRGISNLIDQRQAPQDAMGQKTSEVIGNASEYYNMGILEKPLATSVASSIQQRNTLVQAAGGQPHAVKQAPSVSARPGQRSGM